jgi:hypothetical protein
VHLKKWLPQKAVDTLEKASTTAVACEGEIERVDFCLRPVRFTGSGPLQKTGRGRAVGCYFLVENAVLVPDAGRVGFVS